MKNLLPFLLFGLLLLGIPACKTNGEGKPTFLGEISTPEGLSFSKPIEFNFPIDAKQAGTHAFELELTFDPEAMGDSEQLPLYYQWVMPDQSEKDRRFNVQVKENGNWAGEMHEDATHRRITFVAAENLNLAEGNHLFRLFADTGLNQPLKAVTHVIFRVR